MPQLVLGDVHAPGLAEHHPTDAHVPEIEKVERIDRKAVLEVQEDALGPEEAPRKEAAQRVVPTQPFELPERDVPSRAADEAAVQACPEHVTAAPERVEVAEVGVDARELEVALQGAVGVGHLHDRAPAVRRLQDIVAARVHEREPERVDEAAVDAG